MIEPDAFYKRLTVILGRFYYALRLHHLSDNCLEKLRQLQEMDARTEAAGLAAKLTETIIAVRNQDCVDGAILLDHENLIAYPVRIKNYDTALLTWAESVSAKDSLPEERVRYLFPDEYTKAVGFWEGVLYAREEATIQKETEQ